MRPLSLDPGATAAELARAVALAMVALATAVAAHEARFRGRLLGGVAVGGVVVALVTLGASLGGVASYLEPRVVFVNKNHLASLTNLAGFTALGFAVRARGTRRALWLTAFLVCGTETALSLSRGGISAFVVGAVLFGWLQTRALASEGQHRPGQRALLLGAVGSVVLVAGVLAAGPVLERLETVRDTSREGRLELWPVALRVIRDHAALGIGRGAFATTFAAYKTEPDPYTYTHVENELLQIPIDVGLPLGLLVLGALGWAFWRAMARKDLSRIEVGAIAGVGAVALQNLVDFSLELPGVALPAAVALCTVAPRLGRRVPSWLLRGTAVVAVAAGALALAAGHRYPKDDVVARVEAAGPDGAVAAARPFMAAHPADYLPHAAVGVSLVRADRCSEGMPWLSRAMLLNPTAAVPHHYVARCLAAAHQAALAQREFRLAAELGDAVALEEAARWFASLDDLLQATPDTPAGHRLLAETIAADRPADAARVLEGLWRDYGEEDVVPLLAQARLRAKDDEGALEAARAVLGTQPGDVRATLVAFQALQRLGREDEAWALLEQANRVSPGRPEFVTQLVGPLVKRRRYYEARRLVETIVPETTAEMSARELLTASILIAQGRDEEAAGHLELAASARGARQPLELLATVLEKLGRPAEAVAALQRAAALPGDSTWVPMTPGSRRFAPARPGHRGPSCRTAPDSEITRRQMPGLASARRFSCPRCGSSRVRRSVPQDGWERLVRAATAFHYYRCRDCHHRGSRWGRMSTHRRERRVPSVPVRPVEVRDLTAAALKRRRMVLLVLVAIASGIATGTMVDSCQPPPAAVES